MLVITRKEIFTTMLCTEEGMPSFTISCIFSFWMRKDLSLKSKMNLFRLRYQAASSRLIACAIRGLGYETEWAGNFTMGEKDEHQGFQDAAHKVISFLQEYSKSNPQISGNVKLWITGFSRAVYAGHRHCVCVLF